MAVAHAQLNLFPAGRIAPLRWFLAVFEGPNAGCTRWCGAGKFYTDAVIARGEVVFAFPIALAPVHQVTGRIEAQMADDVLGPTVACRSLFQSPFGGENTITAARRCHPQEIGLVTEQPEAVLDLPDDAIIAGTTELSKRRIDGGENYKGGQY